MPRQLNRQSGLVSRFAVLSVLLIALWNPPAPWHSGVVDLILLLDESESMQPAFLQRSWIAVLDTIKQLPAGSRFSLLRFGGETVTEIGATDIDAPLFDTLQATHTIPGRLPLNRQSTDIESALRFALHQIDPGRSTALLLVSDGIETSGNIARVVDAGADPVAVIHWLAPDKESPVNDAWIDSVNIPRHARRGEKIPLSISVAASYPATGVIQILLDGQLQSEKELSLAAGIPRMISQQLEGGPAGVKVVEVVLKTSGDTRDENNHFAQAVNIPGPRPVLLISASAGQNGVTAILQKRGHAVETILPAQLMQHQSLLQNAAVILLDNVAQGAMQEGAWQVLADAVRRQGKGLIVLGGNRSFGAGGYRHSEFESLLPVVSEAAIIQPAAAVLFVIDKSGSMDHQDAMGNRLGMSRQAVIETAYGLHSRDEVGLISFDTVPRTLLPLDNHKHPGRAIEQVWELPASGGTRLLPALEAAIDALASAQSNKRIMVVVTDGFISDEDFTAIRQRISDHGIEIIALAVGDDADLQILRELASGSNGRVLEIDNIATLPQWMRSELESRRAGMASGVVVPQQLHAIPFMDDPAPSWPEIHGYAVTRARAGSDVLLQAPNGDPLLATRHAGSGRVVAFLPGIGPWTRDWSGWHHWPGFIGELVEWTAGVLVNPRLHIQHTSRAGYIDLLAEALSLSGEWLDKDAITITIIDQAGRQEVLTTRRVAPGQFRSTFKAQLKGLYQLTADSGEQSLHYELFHQAVGEYAADDKAGSTLENAAQSGKVIKWSLSKPPIIEPPRVHHAGLRQPMIVFALLLYLLTIIREREIRLPGSAW